MTLNSREIDTFTSKFSEIKNKIDKILYNDMKKNLLNAAAFVALVLSSSANAQSVQVGCRNGIRPDGTPCGGTIQTAVPFLRINPDARSGAMGDVGIAISPDANSLHFNASKLAFADQDFGASATYTPWLRNLGIDDIYMAYASGFKQFDAGKGGIKQAVGIGLRYFSLGSISWTDVNGSSLGDGSPREFEVSAAYARQLSKKLSLSATGKFIYSNLATGMDPTGGGNKIQSGLAGAVDFGMTYRTPITMSSGKSNLTVGAVVSNIGNKVTYLRTADFLPTNLGVGASWELPFDQYNSLVISADLNKLLVPTPDSTGEWRNLNPISGIFSSFNDAPGGFKEEMREIMISTGLEYWYDKQFAVRTGYFYESAEKGGRQYFTVGLGLKYNVLGINLSYLVPTRSGSRGPLDNTLRFSLLFDAASFSGGDN